MYVCVCVNAQVLLQCVFMLVFEEGEAFQGANDAAAGRLLHTRHPHTPPPKASSSSSSVWRGNH